MHRQRGFTPLETPAKSKTGISGNLFLTGPVRRGLSNVAGFTLVELLVVIAIIALLMSMLMPALARVKKQAKAVACMANLNQMGIAAAMYTGDNDGMFQLGNAGIGHWTHWASAWEPYYRDPDLRCCPTTPKSKARIDEQGNDRGYHNPFVGWGIMENTSMWVKGGHYGSYGINGFVLGRSGDEYSEFWRTDRVKGAGFIPLLLDSPWIDAWPDENEGPPEYEDEHYLVCGGMGRFCVNRHFGMINGVFLDGAVKKIGLKQLWLLRWSRTFDINGPWTIAGGVTKSDWESHGNGWFAQFKDYKDPP